MHNNGSANNRTSPTNPQPKKRSPINQDPGFQPAGGPPMPNSFTNLDSLQQPGPQGAQQPKKNKKELSQGGPSAKGNLSSEQLPKQGSAKNGPDQEYGIFPNPQNQKRNIAQNQGQPGNQFGNNSQRQNSGRGPTNQQQNYNAVNDSASGNGQNYQQGQKKLASQNQNPYMPSSSQGQGFSPTNQGSPNQGAPNQLRKQPSKNAQNPNNKKQQSEEFDDEEDHWDTQNEGQSPSGKKPKQQVYFVKK